MAQKQAEKEQSEISKKFKQNPAVFIGTLFVLIVVIISFVFWGASGWILPNADSLNNNLRAFGYYDKIPVELTRGSFFADVRENFIRQIQQYQMPQDPGQKYESEKYATHEAFKAAVMRTAILEIMKKAHYEPPKTVVDKKVSSDPRFQKDGKFSLSVYREYDATERISIRKNVHDSIIADKYYSDLTKKTPAFSKEANFIGDMAKIQRKFKLAVFPYSMFPKSELVSFVKKNQDLFKNTHLSQITLKSAKSDADAKKVLESIKTGKTTFEDAAKAYSEDNYKQAGGDAGIRTGYELIPLIADDADRAAVINLAAGQLSDLIKVPSGWAIFRAESAATEADISDAGVLDKIRSYMLRSERGIVEDWLIIQAVSFAQTAENGDWATAVIANNIDSYEFGPLPLNYGDSTLFTRAQDFANEVPALEMAGTSENFWRTAFSTPVNKPSAPFVIDSRQQSVVVLMAVEENINEDAAFRSADYYKTTFTENSIEKNISDSILNSSKFQDEFEQKYNALFPRNIEF
ncbi:MAG: peptidylprolyl isomerase [Spirochaetaceae bacterium]|jgi:parvulin-like peptidyl-prolyl isomerase|nr:peptidylprolyl isomerase [Spirochaetaceae bacterium]